MDYFDYGVSIKVDRSYNLCTWDIFLIENIVKNLSFETLFLSMLGFTFLLLELVWTVERELCRQMIGLETMLKDMGRIEHKPLGEEPWGQ